jgi:hypothetical protein
MCHDAEKNTQQQQDHDHAVVGEKSGVFHKLKRGPAA